MKNNGTNRKIILNSNKGNSIKKAGFLTGIHALPPHIKSRLDELLLCRYSPERALSELESEYPNTNLPSKSAVYSYKTKYLPTSLTGVRQVSQAVEQLDIEKMDLAKLFASHIKRFIAIDLNVMLDRWHRGLEDDQEQDKNQKSTDEAGKMYMEAIKMVTVLLNQLNVKMQLDEEPEGKFIVTHDTMTEIAHKYAPELSILAHLENKANQKQHS